MAETLGIPFTRDEFIVMFSLLHHINMNLEEGTEEQDGFMVCRCEFTIDALRKDYSTFRRLMEKLHRVNVTLALESFERWDRP